MYNTAMMAMAGAERVFRLIDRQPDWVDDADLPDLPPIQGRVEFDQVGFEYVQASRSCTSSALPPSRARRSRWSARPARASPRCEPDRQVLPGHGGQVMVDGHDIREVNTESLRTQLGIVLQQNFLFSGTVIDNIRIGRPDATDEQVREGR
jgi:ATP-binding cassette subfamily B protein